MKKGQRKFRCLDCGETQAVHWVELNRARSPRCRGCGGPLEPHSRGAIDDRLIGNANLRASERGDIRKS